MKSPDKCTDAELEPYAREWMRRIRAGKSPRPKVLRACPKCRLPFGARELRQHIPLCKSEPGA